MRRLACEERLPDLERGPGRAQGVVRGRLLQRPTDRRVTLWPLSEIDSARALCAELLEPGSQGRRLPEASLWSRGAQPRPDD